MFKPVKHVTWKGLPPIEEDEKKQKRKMMKDAPKGAEDANVDEEEKNENLEEKAQESEANAKLSVKRTGKQSIDNKQKLSLDRRGTIKSIASRNTKISINSKTIVEKLNDKGARRNSVKLPVKLSIK